MIQELKPAFLMTLVLTVLTGLVYPGVVTGLCQALFPARANGSLIMRNGVAIGSALIGQNFAKPEYFQPRPSAAGNDGYDGLASGGSNLGPISQKLLDRVRAAVDKFHKDNPDYHGPIPADMLTASGSGLDPHISPASALAQAPRVAKSRGISLDQAQQLVNLSIEGPDLGFLGEPRVNVLALNLELNRRFPLNR